MKRIGWLLQGRNQNKRGSSFLEIAETGWEEEDTQLRDSVAATKIQKCVKACLLRRGSHLFNPESSDMGTSEVNTGTSEAKASKAAGNVSRERGKSVQRRQNSVAEVQQGALKKHDLNVSTIAEKKKVLELRFLSARKIQQLHRSNASVRELRQRRHAAANKVEAVFGRNPLGIIIMRDDRPGTIKDQQVQSSRNPTLSQNEMEKRAHGPRKVVGAKVEQEGGGSSPQGGRQRAPEMTQIEKRKERKRQLQPIKQERNGHLQPVQLGNIQPIQQEMGRSPRSNLAPMNSEAADPHLHYAQNLRVGIGEQLNSSTPSPQGKYNPRRNAGERNKEMYKLIDEYTAVHTALQQRLFHTSSSSKFEGRKGLESACLAASADYKMQSRSPPALASKARRLSRHTLGAGTSSEVQRLRKAAVRMTLEATAQTLLQDSPPPAIHPRAQEQFEKKKRDLSIHTMKTSRGNSSMGQLRATENFTTSRPEKGRTEKRSARKSNLSVPEQMAVEIRYVFFLSGFVAVVLTLFCVDTYIASKIGTNRASAEQKPYTAGLSRRPNPNSPKQINLAPRAVQRPSTAGLNRKPKSKSPKQTTTNARCTASFFL
jgi:hypothetical protein